MAQLKDLIVSGPSRLIGDSYIQLKGVTAITSNGGTTYGTGSANQTLMADGNGGVYWNTIQLTFDLGTSTALTGTLPIAKGGTGATTAAAAWTALGGGASGKHADSYFALASHGNHVPTTDTTDNITFLRNDNTWHKLTGADVNTLINLLGEGTSDLTANDYVLTQYVGGGTSNNTYYRRPASKVINEALVKAALGTNATHNNNFLRKDGTWAAVSTANYYHTTGSWSGLTYTATANGGADALAFTIPTGTTSTTVAVGNHTHGTIVSLGEVTRTAGTTVAQAKAEARTLFANSANGRIAAISVPTSYVNQWGNDNGVFSAGSVYGFLALNPGYDNSNYGEFLVSEYGGNKIGHVGLNSQTWSSIHWLLDSNNYSSYALPLTGGTVTGTLTLSKSQDLSGTENNSPALIVGGTATTAHMEIDNNEIQAKSNDTTPIAIMINRDGGYVYLGGSSVYSTGSVLMGAAWNDYAEYRSSKWQQPGLVLSELGNDTLGLPNERLAPFAGVISDTFGYAEGQTDNANTPIAVAGRVLVYPHLERNMYHVGDCVCAMPDGTVDIMTREEIIQWPDRIVGTVSCVPEYETWGEGNVKVDGRIWIKVK